MPSGPVFTVFTVKVWNMRVDPRDLERWRRAAEGCAIPLAEFVRKSVEHAIEMQLNFSRKPTYPVVLSKVPHPPTEELRARFVKKEGVGATAVVENEDSADRPTPSPKKTKPKGDLCPHRLPKGMFCKRCADG